MKVGDVVRLRSGSPRMTVVGFGKTGVRVIWFHYNTDTVQRATIPVVALVRDLQGYYP